MNRAGFSILESIIASAILAIAIMGANMQYVSQLKAQGSMNVTGKARSVMNQSVTDVASNPSNYPNFSNGTIFCTYVLCYNQEGGSIPNSNTLSTTPVGVFMADRTLPATDGGGVSLCNNGNTNPGGFESHISWLSPTQAEIYTLLLPQPGRPFKTVTAIRTIVDL